MTNCDGSATIIANGNARPFTFQWTHRPTTQTLTNLCFGSYSVLVTNAYGCQVMLYLKIGVNCSPSYTFTVSGDVDNACNGNANGTIHSVNGVNSNSSLTYTYLWDDGSTNNYRSNLSSNTYCVTVTSHLMGLKKCEVIECFTVGSNNPQITIEDITPACYGESTGAIDITPSGSQPNNYLYQWNTGAQTQDLSNLSVGTYTVTIIDMVSCQKSKTITVPSYPQLNISYNSEGTCPGGNDGFINTTVSGGTPPYSYNWSNGATSANINNLGTGLYGVTVTDNAGCSQKIVARLGHAPVTESVNPVDCRYTNLWCKGSIIGSNSYGTYFASDPADCRYTNEYCVYTGALYQYHVSYTEPTPQTNGANCRIDYICADGNIYNSYFGNNQSTYQSGLTNTGQPYCDYIEYCNFPNLGLYYIYNITSHLTDQYSFNDPNCPSNLPHLQTFYCNGTPFHSICSPNAFSPSGGENNMQVPVGELIKAVTGDPLIDLKKIIEGEETPIIIELIEKLDLDEIAVFPNPFNDNINIKLSLKEKQEIRISLTNVLGQEVYIKNHTILSGEKTITIYPNRDLPKGSYILTINYNNGKQQTLKLVH